MITIPEILRYASNLSPLVPLLLLLSVQKRRTKMIHILTAIIGVSFLSDIIGFIMVSRGINNAAVSNSYYLIQFFLLMYFYSLQIKNKKPVYVTIIIFISFFISNTLFVQPFNHYQNWLRLAGGIIVIFYAMGYFRKMLGIRPPIDPFYHYPFWINAAIYYYFTFNLLLFAMDNFVYSHMPREVAKAFWGFHNFNNIIKNLLFGVAVIIFKGSEQSPLLKNLKQ